VLIVPDCEARSGLTNVGFISVGVCRFVDRGLCGFIFLWLWLCKLVLIALLVQNTILMLLRLNKLLIPTHHS